MRPKPRGHYSLEDLTSLETAAFIVIVCVGCNRPGMEVVARLRDQELLQVAVWSCHSRPVDHLFQHTGLFSCPTLSLPCDATRCTVLVIVILSVCPSVRPSVTLVHCVHMVRPTIVISSPYGSPIILVSGGYHVHPKIWRGSPWARAFEWGWGGYELAIFDQLSRRISETVRHTTKVTIDD